MSSSNLYSTLSPIELQESRKIIDVLNETLSALAAAEAVLEIELDRKKASVAPIRRLTSDALALVFLQYKLDGNSQWELLKVCRYWRIVASSTPRLWSSILIQDRTYREYQQNSNNYWLCTSAEQLKQGLSWAKASPLDIEIYLNSFGGDERVEKDTLEMLSIPFSRDVVKQWRIIDFQDLSLLGHMVEWDWTGKIPPECFNLESVYLRFDVPAIRAAIRESQPSNLRHVHVTDPGGINEIGDTSWFSPVEDLTLHDTWNYEEDGSTALSILQSCTSLRRLNINGALRALDSAQIKSDTLTTLTFEGKVDSFTGRYLSLKHLTIVAYPNLTPNLQNTDSSNIVHLPALISFHFTGQHIQLLSIHAPNLEEFEWHVEDRTRSWMFHDSLVNTVNSELQREFSKGNGQYGATPVCYLPRPSRFLKLSSVPLKSDTLAQLLRTIGPNVVKFELITAPENQQRAFWDSLHLPIPTKRNKNPNLKDAVLPNLQHLHLDLTSINSNSPSEKKMYRWFMALKKNRFNAKRALSTFTCRFVQLWNQKIVEVGVDMEAYGDGIDEAN